MKTIKFQIPYGDYIAHTLVIRVDSIVSMREYIHQEIVTHELFRRDINGVVMEKNGKKQYEYVKVSDAVTKDVHTVTITLENGNLYNVNKSLSEIEKMI